MNFRTEIKIPEAENKIDYKSSIVTFGSCFVENIGEKLDYFKFPITKNPFGILFHPVAIENAVRDIVEEKKYEEKDFVFQNERWHSFKHHSVFSNASLPDLIKNTSEVNIQTKEKLQKATHIFITLGTAWVYEFLESGNLVSNCHKIPQKEFQKHLLKTEEIENSLKNIISMLKKENPEVSILFTVSPVRHIKNGIVENMRSKANLLSAIHNVIDRNENCFYFPSFEIMMDDLRDYRFYKDDFLHPNSLAIEYIWEKFQKTWIFSKIFSVMKEVDSVQKGLLHKPFNPDSEQHIKFLRKLNIRKENLSKKNDINF
ncbi:GSCFA domain-containing protein [Aureivirga sp. CE67]|uniref:GSCFA domain-containing protein n=1 Tax=Aureivirga sp. CE67 TaxID=1788983 RepID=UPI0018C9781F|nr:GSCFA domain-containing protein [Aureivirga sp. CE67]